MIRLIPRAVAAAILGAFAGAALLVLGYAVDPDIVFEMDRDLPRIVAGVYAIEREGTRTFAWTSRRATVTLAGLDRRAAWSCTFAFRGARPDPRTQPDVDVAIDGVTAAVRRATNTFQDFEVTAPARPLRPGLDLTITSSQTYAPGGSDPRTLGIQVDRLTCRPAEAGGIVLPPRRALGSAALASALFGAAFGLSGISAGSAVAAAVLMAGAQAGPLGSGAAPYTGYVGVLVWLAAWIGVGSVAVATIAQRWIGQPLRNTARFVVLFSAGALYLQLLGLFHPSKPLVDALFQAHRLEWVLDGRYFFTQPMPDGVQFPYAIGLYLFAAPWTMVTRDHVALLRIIVCACHIVSGALLYLVVVRNWGDRVTAAVAVALFCFVPLPYRVIGNANLTNAFGQSIALMTMAAVASTAIERRPIAKAAIWTLLATLAFLSHVSTVALLLAALVAIGGLFIVRGGPIRRDGRAVLLAATVAAAISFVTYYGHFGEVYRTLDRVTRATTEAGAKPAAQNMDASAGGAREPPDRNAIPSAPERVADALVQTVSSIGWPIVLLALVGIWRVSIDVTPGRQGGAAPAGHDRLVLVLAGWGIAWLAFVLFTVLIRVGPGYQRYAAEFLGRVDLATYPAAVILAARGAFWMWRRGLVLRVASGVLVSSAVLLGVREWLVWFH